MIALVLAVIGAWFVSLFAGPAIYAAIRRCSIRPSRSADCWRRWSPFTSRGYGRLRFIGG